jgi:hypothetical protein
MALDDPFNANNAPIEGDAGNNFYNFSEEDPAAEFLEREKRELGDITGDEPSNAESISSNTMTNGISSSCSSSIVRSNSICLQVHIRRIHRATILNIKPCRNSMSK